MNQKDVAIRGKMIKMAAEIGMLRSSGTDRQWSRALCRRLLGQKPMKTVSEAVTDCGGNDDATWDSDEYSVEVEMRIRALKRLVPGGESMEMDALFEETADYIQALRGQVSVMKALTESNIDGTVNVERERRLMNG